MSKRIYKNFVFADIILAAKIKLSQKRNQKHLNCNFNLKNKCPNSLKAHQIGALKVHQIGVNKKSFKFVQRNAFFAFSGNQTFFTIKITFIQIQIMFSFYFG